MRKIRLRRKRRFNIRVFRFSFSSLPLVEENVEIQGDKRRREYKL